MAKMLTNDSVIIGYLLPMENMERTPSEKERYYALKIEDSSGKNEEWLLLTENEILSRQIFSVEDLTKDWKLGRCFTTRIGRRTYSACRIRICETMSNEKITFPGKTELTLLFTRSMISSGRKRREKNPEDIPRQCKLRDLLD